MVALNFDARTVAPSEPFEPVPTGWYTGQIVQSEEKENKPKGDGSPLGKHILLTIELLDPPQYRGRKVFDRLNLQNSSAQAVEIAYKTLSAIQHAVGVIQMNDTQQLHGRPFKVKVNYKAQQFDAESGKTYDASNDVKGYKDVNHNGAGPAEPAQTQSSFQPPNFAAPRPATAQSFAPAAPQHPAAPAPFAPQQFQQQGQAPDMTRSYPNGSFNQPHGQAPQQQPAPTGVQQFQQFQQQQQFQPPQFQGGQAQPQFQGGQAPQQFPQFQNNGGQAPFAPQQQFQAPAQQFQPPQFQAPVQQQTQAPTAPVQQQAQVPQTAAPAYDANPPVPPWAPQPQQ